MAAMPGMIGSEMVLLGLIALPQTIRLDYNQNLAIGTICASGSPVTMIPPSIVLLAGCSVLLLLRAIYFTVTGRKCQSRECGMLLVDSKRVKSERSGFTSFWIATNTSPIDTKGLGNLFRNTLLPACPGKCPCAGPFPSFLCMPNKSSALSADGTTPKTAPGNRCSPVRRDRLPSTKTGTLSPTSLQQPTTDARQDTLRRPDQTAGCARTQPRPNCG